MIKLRQNERDFLVAVFRDTKNLKFLNTPLIVLNQHAQTIAMRLVNKNLLKIMIALRNGRRVEYLQLADNFTDDMREYIEECITIEDLQR